MEVHTITTSCYFSVLRWSNDLVNFKGQVILKNKIYLWIGYLWVPRRCMKNTQWNSESHELKWNLKVVNLPFSHIISVSYPPHLKLRYPEIDTSFDIFLVLYKIIKYFSTFCWAMGIKEKSCPRSIVIQLGIV